LSYSSQWPKCGHYDMEHSESMNVKCKEDAIGFCSICKLDACEFHMSEHHRHLSEREGFTE